MAGVAHRGGAMTGLGYRLSLGALALALIGALTLGAVMSIALVGARDGIWPSLGPADWRALRFTLVQAFWSAALSLIGGLILARALARRRFAGRGLAITLLGAPFLLPVIVAVLGIVAIWGRSGPLSGALMAMGGPRLNVYGLPGVLIAHVFFNLPLATRIFLQALAQIPSERGRLAAQLGLTGRAYFQHVDRPALFAAAPGAFALIFLICAASFAVVLALGGGPRATTLELAIYQALRFDFDLPRAALLALCQMTLCIGIGAAALALAAPVATDPGLGAPPRRWDMGGRATDRAALIAAALFLGAPMAAVLLRGGAAIAAGLPPQVWQAAGRSAAVALGSALLAMALTGAVAALIVTAERRGLMHTAKGIEGAAALALATPPMVMGLGLFVMLRGWADPFALALPVTGLVNAAMTLPFALRLVLPALRHGARGYGRLADQLGLRGAAWARHALWPSLRRPLGFAAGLAAALSAGDLGVIALFAPADAPTLPLLVHQLMGAYRMEAAAGASLLLLALSLGLFAICDLWGRWGDRHG
jgi:thiamine transport system permease protein